MTTAPHWYAPPGHPRETQLKRDWKATQRERRTGGRAMRLFRERDAGRGM